MKTIFVSANYKRTPQYEKVINEINEIPYKKIAICYSNQFLNIAKEVSEKIDKEIISKHQVLGCSNPKFSKEVEAILIIGQGRFHTVSIAYESKLPTFVLEDSKLWQVQEEEVTKMEKREKGMYLKYLTSKKIGIIITNKPGQQRMKKALEFNRELKDPLIEHKNLQAGKKGYLFIANDINISEFENFKIDTWVNTSCPRMDLTDGSLINLDKLQKLQVESN